MIGISSIANSIVGKWIVNHFTPPSPDWGTYSTIYSPFEVNVGDFPVTDKMHFNTKGFTSALTGAVSTPVTDDVWLNGINIGVSGYSQSESPTKHSCGVFGAASLLAGGTQSFGGNFVASNTPSINFVGDIGQDFDSINGMEADVYVAAKPGGVAPTGTGRGIYVTGFASQRPVTGYYGVHIGSGGVAGWSHALVIGDGPNTRGIQIGAANTSVAAPTNIQSQVLSFVSRDASGVTNIANQFSSPSGTMVIRGGATNPSVQLQGAANAAILTAGTLTGAIFAHAPVHHEAKNIYTPSAGQTVVMPDDDEIAIINVTGTLATLTYQLPTASAAYEGKIVRWNQRCTITTLTVTATAGTVLNAPTTVAPGEGIAFICVGTFWFRLY
jgi:hypothetical protein